MSNSTESQMLNPTRTSFEVTHLRDHFFVPAFKISLLLSWISGLQVISPDLIGRESEIPFSFENEPEMDEASGALVVNINE